MTDDDIKNLRALCEKAAPGPWGQAGTAEKPYPSVSSADRMRGYQVHSMDHLIDRPERQFMWEQWNHDAAFIAAARSAVPALLDEVERLRALVESARSDALLDAANALADEADPDLPMPAGARYCINWLREAAKESDR